MGRERGLEVLPTRSKYILRTVVLRNSVHQCSDAGVLGLIEFCEGFNRGVLIEGKHLLHLGAQQEYIRWTFVFNRRWWKMIPILPD